MRVEARDRVGPMPSAPARVRSPPPQPDIVRTPLGAAAPAAFWSALVGLAAVTVLVVLAWAAAPEVGTPPSAALASGGQAWLLIQGGDLQLAQGSLTLVPWGLLLLPAYVLVRSGRWAVARSRRAFLGRCCPHDRSARCGLRIDRARRCPGFGDRGGPARSVVGHGGYGARGPRRRWVGRAHGFGPARVDPHRASHHCDHRGSRCDGRSLGPGGWGRLDGRCIAWPGTGGRSTSCGAR